jgi:hypothetical protein
MDGRLSTHDDLHLLLVPPVREDVATCPMPGLAQWHQSLWNNWSPILRKVAGTTELDQPESSLPHHILRARHLGKKPVVIQFRPPHQVYPWPEAPLVTASHWDQGMVPCRPLFNDVRWNWSLTLPLVQGLLAASPLTRDAWSEGGFSGHTLLMPLGEEGKVTAASKVGDDGFVAHRLPVGPGGSPEVLEIWQEGAHIPRGITKKTYFWARKTYHHQIKERMPGWLNQSMLGSWKWVRKQFKKPTPPAWLNPAPLDNPGCVILLRWDPLKDHWAGVRVLAACAQGLQSSQDTALVVRMPDGDGRWQERLNALAKVAERLPAWDGALVAQSDSQIVKPGDCLPRLDWAITWETDLDSALWAVSLKKAGIGIIGTDVSCLHDGDGAFPGHQVATTMIPCTFEGTTDKVLESWRPHPRVESLCRAIAHAAQQTNSSVKHGGASPADGAPLVHRLGQFLSNLANQQSSGRMAA